MFRSISPVPLICAKSLTLLSSELEILGVPLLLPAISKAALLFIGTSKIFADLFTIFDNNLES